MKTQRAKRQAAARQRMARILDAVVLVAIGMQILFFIGSTAVPTEHVQRECVPIGAALEAEEAQPEYESIGDWVIRR
jgi:uncharacterized membrane protein YfbV (UPF0208 family)